MMTSAEMAEVAAWVDEHGCSSDDNAVFGKFFGCAKECRSLMQQWECIASGAAVLSALNPGGTPECSKLELYVMASVLGIDGYYVWSAFFRESGYLVTQEVADGGRQSRTFVYENIDQGTSVRFVVTECEPVRYVIRNAWSTHLMNIATWEGIYCPFPKLTLDECRMVLLRRPTLEELQLFGEYYDFEYSKMSLCVAMQRREVSADRSIGDEITSITRFGSVSLYVGDREIEGWRSRMRNITFSFDSEGVCVA